jgi:hypothetical protein
VAGVRLCRSSGAAEPRTAAVALTTVPAVTTSPRQASTSQRREPPAGRVGTDAPLAGPGTAPGGGEK